MCISLSLICFFVVQVVVYYVPSIIFTFLIHKQILLYGSMILSIVMNYDIYDGSALPLLN
jgi:hypothetical protein